MAQHDDSLAKEIDEELRREQLLKLWERYGTYIIIVSCVILLGVGGFKYLEHRRLVAAETAGAQYAKVVRDVGDKKGDAQATLEAVAKNNDGGYGTLARLRLAGTDAAAGRTAAAVASYEAIAAVRGLDKLLADFARLQAALLRLDTAEWTEMQNRLTPLLDEQNPWRFSAGELLGLAAMKAGKPTEARQQFERILASPAAPQSISERARMMMGVLTEAELTKSGSTAGAAPAKESASTKSGEAEKAGDKH